MNHEHKYLLNKIGIENFIEAQKLDIQTDLATLEIQIKNCERCSLSRSRKMAVPGEGPISAKLILIGEAPGENEDEVGKPFVGVSGELLDKMILAMGFKRDEVFITNTVKCRPPKNRNPNEDEIVTCSNFLEMQLHSLTPKLVIAFGRIAAQFLLNTNKPLAKLRAEIHNSPKFGLPVLCTYHPSYLLRKPEEKRAAWEDLKLAMKFMAQ